MAKALKFFVILILLLGGGALYLSFELFNKREVLKYRTQEGENALAAVAKSLESTNFNKAALIADNTNDFPRLKAAQQVVIADAVNTFANMKATGLDLTNTLARLDETNKVLAATLATLAEREAEIVRLNETVNQKNTEIAQKEGQINELKTAKAALEDQVKDRDDKIAKNEEMIKDLKDEIKADQEDIKRISAELTACMSRDGEEAYMRPGVAGRVLKVNDEWNFVVLNIGTTHGAVPTGTMIVHRGEKMVGKVQIAVVNKDMCIATIMREWAQGEIKEGDFVVH
jgi:chromosome segregation ATPase